MTAPMTPARLEEIRFAIERAKSDADRGDLHPDDDINHVVGLELLEETDRLRALPVLRTCGDCRWCEPVSWPPSPSCQHPRTLAAHQIGYMPVNVDATPPATCPLRGER